MHTRPTPAVYLRRRRIAVAILIVLAIAAAAGLGVGVQKVTGWSEEDWARHTSVREPADFAADAAPTTAIAIPDPEAAPAAVQDKPPVTRVPDNPRPLDAPPAPGEMGQVRVESGGVGRKVLLSVPVEAERVGQTPPAPRPLIISYHGYRESPSSMARYSGFDQDGAIVAYPQGLGEAWEGAPYAKASKGQDVQFTRDLLDAISATYQVDAHRVYAAGMSNGGGFAVKLACEMPREFAAVASVAGAYYPDTWRGCAAEASAPAGSADVAFADGPAVPLLEIHGRVDSTIEYEGGTRHRSRYLGAMQFSGLYAGRSGCFGAPSTTRVTDKILRVQWPGCAHGGEVTHLGIADAGHTWPGETTGESGAAASGSAASRSSNAVTATNEIKAFFHRHGAGGDI